MSISIGLATLISGLAAAGAAGGQAIGASKMNKRAERYAREENALNRQFQAEQAQMGRDYQEEMYNKYYSPSAQMQQFKDAGINPITAVGQITGQGGMSSPSPSGGSSIQPQYSNPMDSLGGIVDSVLAISKLKQEISESKAREHYYNSQGDKAESDIKVNDQTITNMVTENSQMLNDIALSNKKYENECKELDNLIKKTTNEIEQGKQNIEESKKRVEEIEQRIKKLSSDIELNDQQKSYLASMVTLIGYQSQTEQERKTNLQKQGNLYDKQSGLIQHQEWHLDNQSVLIKRQTWEQDYRNKYLYLFGVPPEDRFKNTPYGITDTAKGLYGLSKQDKDYLSTLKLY